MQYIYMTTTNLNYFQNVTELAMNSFKIVRGLYRQKVQCTFVQGKYIVEQQLVETNKDKAKGFLRLDKFSYA